MKVIVEFNPDGSMGLRVPEGEPVDFTEARARLEQLRRTLGADGVQLANPDQPIEQHVHAPEGEGVRASH